MISKYSLGGAALLLALLGWSWMALQRPQRADRPSFIWQSVRVMGTQIKVLAPVSRAKEAAGDVFRIFRAVDSMMSEWKSTSPLAAINKAAGLKPMYAPAELRALLKQSIAIGKMTDGAFDLTWAALWGVWNFRKKDPKPPSPMEIQRRLKWIDYRKVQLDARSGKVFLPFAGMKIGLGGIAKGYALQRAARQLQRKGIRHFLISAGGQIIAGAQRAKRPWRIGIRDPRGSRDDFFAILQVHNTSVSTSGDYERFFFYKGKRYHHILDPKTGRPTRGLRSVTIVTRDAVLADALSTAIMVLGKQKGMALVQKLPQVEAVLVDHQAKIYTTPGIRSQLQLIHSPKQ